MKSRRRWTNTIKRNHPLKRMWSLTRWGGHVRQKPETYFLWNQADFTRSNRKRISKMDLLPISILWKKKTFTDKRKRKITRVFFPLFVFVSRGRDCNVLTVTFSALLRPASIWFHASRNVRWIRRTWPLPFRLEDFSKYALRDTQLG